MSVLKYGALVGVLIAGLGMAGCQRDADVASHNLSKAADQFEINRRIVFYNGINGEYMLTMTGLCSLKDQGNQLEVVCKVGPGTFKKHFLGLSDNVTYFAEHLEPTAANVYRYEVVFKPSVIIPDIDVELGL